MSFSASASLVSTDMDNTLRGLYRDNADHGLGTGYNVTANETDAASTTITGGTIGTTGLIHICASGTVSGAGGTKTIRLYLGSTAVYTRIVTAGSGNYVIDVWIFNTAANAQRIQGYGIDGVATSITAALSTASIDTASNQTLKITQQLAVSSDVIIQKTFSVFVCQIT